MRSVFFVVPGSLENRTGGYIYDRRIIAGLRDDDWLVEVRELDESFPHPTSAALERAARVLAAIPRDATVVIDGLACGAMPEQVEREAARLRIVALVHHPLAHETGLSAQASAAFEASERRALASARLVIVTSTRTAQAVTRFGVAADRIAVVEPGTDRAPVAKGSRSDSVHLLCVASLTPRKGHETLFRALGRLREWPWRLTCVGSADRDTATAAHLRDVLRETGIEDRVSLAGEADEEAVVAYYDHADVFVLPTEYEGYGMVVAEALARGLPIVSTPTGAIPEMAIDGSGILVTPGDVDALTAALALVINDRDARARLSRAAVLVRDRLPSWKVVTLRMGSALERAATVR